MYRKSFSNAFSFYICNIRYLKVVNLLVPIVIRSGNKLRNITLWSDYAQQLNDALGDRQNLSHVVIILQFMKHKIYKRESYLWKYNLLLIFHGNALTKNMNALILRKRQRLSFNPSDGDLYSVVFFCGHSA